MNTLEQTINGSIKGLVERVSASVELRCLKERREQLVAELAKLDAKITTLNAKIAEIDPASAKPAAKAPAAKAPKGVKTLAAPDDGSHATEAKLEAKPKKHPRLRPDEESVRSKILAILEESDEPLRPVDIAKKLDVPQPAVRDRLSTLRRAGTVTSELRIGGAVYSMPRAAQG